MQIQETKTKEDVIKLVLIFSIIFLKQKYHFSKLLLSSLTLSSLLMDKSSPLDVFEVELVIVVLVVVNEL